MTDYYLLKDDIDDLIAGYESNDAITENQREQWYKEGKKAAITHTSFGCGGKKYSNPLRLLKADGWNGEPVGSFTGRSAQSYFDYNENHVFPPLVDLVRIGVFFHLSLYRTCALALKGEWESFFAKTVNNYRANTGVRLIDILKDRSGHEMREANNRFNPDTQVLFDTLEYYQKQATAVGYNIKSFDIMIQNMLKNELHWKRNEGRSVAAFAEAEQKRLALLREGTTAEQEAYWTARMSWQQSQSELDDIHLQIENFRLKNREIERRWLCEFGKQEIDIQVNTFKFIDLERRLLLLQTNPGMTLEELETVVENEEEKHFQQQRKLKSKALISELLDKRDIEGTPSSHEILINHQKECKRLIRKIYKLIHPDSLEAHPKFLDLTDNQKEELNQFLIACLEPDSDELGFPKGFFNADMRSPEGLARVLARIQEVLDNAGLEIPSGVFIRGETLAEQLVWLNREIERLEKDRVLALDRLKDIAADPEVKRKQKLLDQPEQHQQIKEEMQKKIEELQTAIRNLEVELAKILTKKA